MTEPAASPHASSGRTQARQFRIGALIVLVLAVALILWLVLRDSDSSSTSSTSTSAKLVTADDIKALGSSVNHPVFWLGPRNDSTYELTQSKNGSIFVRYLPSDVKAGSDKPYLTVATYPFPGAYQALQKVGKDRGVRPISIAGNGIVLPDKSYPASIHAAYPGVDYQVEVFDPSPGKALQLVTTGALAHVGPLKTTTQSTARGAAAKAASVQDLKALASSVGHPVYWAGPKSGFTYEVMQDPSGKVFIRYLPKGVSPGASAPYLTVATYPFPSAFGAIQALAKESSTNTIKLDNGGLAIVDSKSPKSIHLAYPGSDYQVEIFDPSAARAQQIVSSKQIREVG